MILCRIYLESAVARSLEPTVGRIRFGRMNRTSHMPVHQPGLEIHDLKLRLMENTKHKMK